MIEPVSKLSVVLTRTADKAQRKLDKPLRMALYEALERLSQNPEGLGERLTSPLSGVLSHHIKYQGREFRVAYQILPEAECLVVLLIGPHENFYRRLKQLLDAA